MNRLSLFAFAAILALAGCATGTGPTKAQLIQQQAAAQAAVTAACASVTTVTTSPAGLVDPKDAASAQAACLLAQTIAASITAAVNAAP